MTLALRRSPRTSAARWLASCSARSCWIANWIGERSTERSRADFGRFGIDWWPELTKRDTRTTGRQQHLDVLNRARNAIVHSLPGKLVQLESEGHPATLVTVEKWRRGLNALAATMDEVLASHIAQLKNGPLPW